MTPDNDNLPPEEQDNLTRILIELTSGSGKVEVIEPGKVVEM